MQTCDGGGPPQRGSAGLESEPVPGFEKFSGPTYKLGLVFRCTESLLGPVSAPRHLCTLPLLVVFWSRGPKPVDDVCAAADVSRDVTAPTPDPWVRFFSGAFLIVVSARDYQQIGVLVGECSVCFLV